MKKVWIVIVVLVMIIAASLFLFNRHSDQSANSIQGEPATEQTVETGRPSDAETEQTTDDESETIVTEELEIELEENEAVGGF